jgi:hypothetical protein
MDAAQPVPSARSIGAKRSAGLVRTQADLRCNSFFARGVEQHVPKGE